MMRVARFWGILFASLTSLGVVLSTPLAAVAAAPQGNFSLQVSPSPLVATLKPGETRDLELKIRNASTASEELTINAQRFTFDSLTGEVKLDDTAPPEARDWLTFSHPTFTVKPGEWFTQTIRIALPQDTGFSYSFALVISRTSLPSSHTAGQLLNGSVAVFTLLNVDRPGATRKLDLESLTTSQTVYEYLPTTFAIAFKNTGNTIVQPYGNVFVSRGSDTSQPIATLPVNGNQSYLLPGTTRTLHATWSDGFPLYTTTTDSVGAPQTSLAWNWDNISHFRFGRYTATVVAVYNDGVRDVPIQKVVTFWVIPWKAILLVIILITTCIFLLRWYIRKRTDRAVKKALAAREQTEHHHV